VSKKFLEKTDELPTAAGVYLFRDRAGNPLYVGKAINLRHRVRSYFHSEASLGTKTALMVSQIARVEHFETASEIEAFLLEADLIKRLKPKYNRQLKDDKAYPLIKITRDEFPRVKMVREKVSPGTYFGPFPHGSVHRVLKLLRRAFPYADCSSSKFAKYQKVGRGCLFADLALCPAPCVGKITAEKYQEQISELRKFLRGRGGGIVKNLKLKMKSAAEKENFEEAAEIKKRISQLNYIRQRFKTPNLNDLEINLPADRRRGALEELQAILGITSLPARIEAYDISNISGKEATGSMVVFINGDSRKDHYRRFKIKTLREPDDVGMIKEVLLRRFSDSRITAMRPQQSYVKRDLSFSTEPNLLLIDGGKGQVSAALEVLRELGLSIPVAALAKSEEELYYTGALTFDGRCESPIIQGPLRLPRHSEALQLLQRARDEAHRFALAYHRKLRRKKLQ